MKFTKYAGDINKLATKITVLSYVKTTQEGSLQGRIQDFQKGGHTLIERAISYHLSQKGCMYVGAPQAHVVIRAAPCRAGNSQGTRTMVGVPT